jgi:hypothetical protein
MQVMLKLDGPLIWKLFLSQDGDRLLFMLSALTALNLIFAVAWVMSSLLCVLSLIVLFARIIVKAFRHRSGTSPGIKPPAIFGAITFFVAVICFASQSLCLHIFYLYGGHMR